MKGKLTPFQLKALLVSGGLLLLGGGLGWFGLGQATSAKEEAEALAARVAKPGLAEILISGEASTVQEAKKLKENESKLAEVVSQRTSPWVRATQSATGLKEDGSLEEWAKDPGKWKDRLLNLTDQFRKLAKERSISVPDDFLFGLEEYKTKSPASAEVPQLALQLSAAYRLCELLAEARGKAKESYPTKCILRQIGQSKLVEEKQKGTSAESSSVAPRISLRMSMECSPEVLLGWIQNMVTDDWLFLPMNLKLENEQVTFKKRSEVRKDLGGEEKKEGAGNQTAATSVVPKLLLVLAGKEKIKVDSEVDYLGWKAEPVLAKAGEKKH